jgi:predicted amidohydrolase YtcJ
VTRAVAAPAGTAVGTTARGTLVSADRIVTLGHARTDAVALLVRGSRVVWVGDAVEDAPPHQDHLDLRGCVIGPAFVDAHVHLTPTGLARTGLDLAGATNGAEVRHALAAFAAQHTGAVLWGHGVDLDGLGDDRPDTDELARIADGRAVYLEGIDARTSLVDRRTLASAPLARTEGLVRGPDGIPTGVLRGEANAIARRWVVGGMDDAELSAARREVVRHAAGLGIGSVHEMGGPDLMGLADFESWAQGDWPIEVVPYWASLDLDVPLALGLRAAGGDLHLDGSLLARTAALEDDYHDRPGCRGVLEIDDERLATFFQDAALAGLQTAVHATGDAAIRQVVRCWRDVERRLGREGLHDTVQRGRHRIEHAEMLPDDLLDDIADLGLVLSTQPAFTARWSGPDGLYATRLGPDRAARVLPFRAITDRGIGLAFGSDADVTPLDPWGTIHSAEHRLVRRHAVSRLEAVSMSTLGGRHAARQERYVGVVRAGMRADLAAFEGDPYIADDPRGTRCVLTLVAGRVAYGDAPLPDAPGR